MKIPTLSNEKNMLRTQHWACKGKTADAGTQLHTGRDQRVQVFSVGTF